MTKDEKIAKLGKEITDRATVLLGKDKITPESPEYLGINSALKYTAYKYDQKMADDILDICLTMKKRVPLTIEQLRDEAYAVVGKPDELAFGGKVVAVVTDPEGRALDVIYNVKA